MGAPCSAVRDLRGWAWKPGALRAPWTHIKYMENSSLQEVECLQPWSSAGRLLQIPCALVGGTSPDTLC